MTATDPFDGPFPRYRSHKVGEVFLRPIREVYDLDLKTGRVEAAKITKIQKFGPGPPYMAVLSLEIGGGEVELKVPDAYILKHDPQVGGYWVRYPDGYESWSPAEAFESGYALVDADDDGDREERAHAHYERELQVKAGGGVGHDVVDLPAKRVWPVVVKVAGKPIIEIDPDGVVEVKGHVLKAQT